MEKGVRNEDLIREILRHVCDRNEIAIMSTPYMRFETTFLRLEDDRFHCHANMTLEEAKFGLRSPDLLIRFPYGHHFYEGATRLLGLGRAMGRQSLQLAIPVALEDGEFRRAYRVDRVGRVPVTFSTRKYDLLQATLVNMSTSGFRLAMPRTCEELEIQGDEEIRVAFTLAGNIRVNTMAKVRYLRDKTFGAEFRPVLDGPLLDDLARWAFQRREEAAVAALGRSGSEEEIVPMADQPGAELILVSSSSELGDRLATLLAGELPPLRRITPTIQSIRDLGPSRQALALFHVDSTTWETRKRIRTLAEALPAGVTFALVGTGLEFRPLYEVGAELNAAASYALPDNPSPMFAKLIQGMYRKTFPANS